MARMRIGTWLLPVAVATVLAAGASATAATPSRPPLLGFQSESDPPALITRDASALAGAGVGVDGLNLSGAAGAVSAPDAAETAQLAAAHRAGLKAVLLVGNYSDAIGDFSEPLAWRTLRSPTATARVAATLAGDVRASGWDGVSIDLESLTARDRPGLARLVDDLRATLGPRRSITVCVENLPSPAAYADNGYDLRALARSADQLVLMAYDQHGPWEPTPGPVGATPWVTGGLRALLHDVRADQVDLGVAGYGYEWSRHGSRQLSDAAAARLARSHGARMRWVTSAGEWTARLAGGATIWWSDARTLASREALARRFHLHGLALWSLGLAARLH